MKFEFSAGGIVIKKEAGKIYVLLAQHSQHHGWIFPKGLIGDHIKNETKELTALREVQEETGVKAKIFKPLPSIEYWYNWNNEKIKKKVYYYLMKYVSGDITNHDTEMEKVEWLSLDEVENRLTYQSDKNTWHEAKTILKNLPIL